MIPMKMTQIKTITKANQSRIDWPQIDLYPYKIIQDTDIISGRRNHFGPTETYRDRDLQRQRPTETETYRYRDIQRQRPSTETFSNRDLQRQRPTATEKDEDQRLGRQTHLQYHHSVTRENQDNSHFINVSVWTKHGGQLDLWGNVRQETGRNAQTGCN